MAAVITNTTAAMAPMASPRMNDNCKMKRPRRERMTVVPANTTALPEVARDRAMASRGSRPSASPWR